MPKKKAAQPPAVIPPPVLPDRVEQVVKWILKGEREFDVVTAAVATWPEQDIAALMGAVADHFRDVAQIEDPDVVRGWSFAATQEVYRLAIATNQPMAALAAIKRLMEIAQA